MAAASRMRFNWEEAVLQDRDLQRIDALVKLTVFKLPEQPLPRADAGRGGSRYQPAPPPAPIVKAEQRPKIVTTSASPQFINPRDYQSESSSEIDTREVNPMDELSDFESETPQQQVDQEQVQNQNQDQNQDQDYSMDVVMEGDDPNEEEQTVCEVCERSFRESEMILCDDCDAEFHIFCLTPPLPEVPEGTWCCPKCRIKHPAASIVTVKEEQARTAAANENDATKSAANLETATTEQTIDSGDVPTSGATPISIAQALAGDPKKSNLLLIHACNCDQIECMDNEFSVFCPHMKRFLRSVCWASHSDKWRSYRLAQITAELFAYHAMNCKLSQCNVPLCVKIREEEIV